jgi:membrane peptidoglycan carboxypeptidase
VGKNWSRKTKILIAAAAVVVLLVGTGVFSGLYFYDSVELPPPVTEEQSNVILDSAGNVLARLGDQNRTVVPEAKINRVVEHAFAAAEDKDFYTHDGAGGSPISRQYARHLAGLKTVGINRKLHEAVIARKLESHYNKDQIMGMYLNWVDEGEGRLGVEAAAQGYFGKSVTTSADSENAVTPEEAVVLAAIIKQPYPVQGGAAGFDPNYNPTGAKDRWEYTMKNMLDMGWITQQQYDQRKYPTVKKPGTNDCETCADGKPVGMIIRHVRAELTAAGISEAQLDQGGFTITTSIDPRVQQAAEEAGSARSKTSPMHDLPSGYQSAVVAINPGTGRVLGYYGGDDARGVDYAGYLSGDGTRILGGQSPGATFEIYTLAAGLRQGLSFDSKWDAQKRRANGTKIDNAGADDNALCQGHPRDCDLETATVRSYNFPFYWIADAIGAGSVVEAAKEAGLKRIFPDGKQIPVDLTVTDKDAFDRDFDREVGFGQYRVVPLEHAEGVATIVGDGVHHAAHFVRSATRVDAGTGKTDTLLTEDTTGSRVFAAAETSNELGVMQKIVGADGLDLEDGRASAAESGIWQFDDGRDSHAGSGDCWFVGGIPQLAVTVWVGGRTKKVELHLKDGHTDMTGADVPGDIWRQVLDTSARELHLQKASFPARATTGDPARLGNGRSLRQELVDRFVHVRTSSTLPETCSVTSGIVDYRYRAVVTGCTGSVSRATISVGCATAASASAGGGSVVDAPRSTHGSSSSVMSASTRKASTSAKICGFGNWVRPAAHFALPSASIVRVQLSYIPAAAVRARIECGILFGSLGASFTRRRQPDGRTARRHPPAAKARDRVLPPR